MIRSCGGASRARACISPLGTRDAPPSASAPAPIEPPPPRQHLPSCALLLPSRPSRRAGRCPDRRGLPSVPAAQPTCGDPPTRSPASRLLRGMAPTGSTATVPGVRLGGSAGPPLASRSRRPGRTGSLSGGSASRAWAWTSPPVPTTRSRPRTTTLSAPVVPPLTSRSSRRTERCPSRRGLLSASVGAPAPGAPGSGSGTPRRGPRLRPRAEGLVRRIPGPRAFGG